MSRVLRIIIIVIVIVSYSQKCLVMAQVAPDKYLIELTDKNNSSYTIENPEEFLSQRAIERRNNQNIAIQFNDLPVSPFYLDSLSKLNLTILNKSKWFNSVIIYTTDYKVLEILESISFVKKVHINQLSPGRKSNSKFGKEKLKIPLSLYGVESDEYDYGFAANQIEMVSGQFLHDLNYRGQGMHIAILDAGFAKADTINAFDNIWADNRVLGTRDFVDGGEIEFKKHYHGTAVWSIIGANIPGVLVGTAPEAEFWLLRTEDGSSEYRIEEENWISAIEFADSAGVDVANTSLGYSLFDDSLQNYSYEDMDGNHARISIAAEIAASKGMICVTSAGNEGNNTWHYITAPGDADSNITVGAVDTYTNYVNFSSVGPTYDGRIKPNVVAQGYNSAFQVNDEEVHYGAGTSFSSPLIAGLVACLWQAMPELTNIEIIESIEQTSSSFDEPNDYVGYGLPDFIAALNKLRTKDISLNKSKLTLVYPTLIDDRVYYDFYSDTNQRITVYLSDIDGDILRLHSIDVNAGQIYNLKIRDLGPLKPGFYILRVITDSQSYQRKLIKP